MSETDVFRVRHRRGWRRLTGRTLLTLDRHGVTRHTDWVFVAWADVGEVRVESAPSGGRTVVFGPISVRARDLDVDLEDLFTAVHRFTAARINQWYTART